MKSKLELIKTEETFFLEENKNFYLGAVKYLFVLTSKLKSEDSGEFWTKFNITDLIKELNNVNNVTKLLNRYIFNLNVDVEVVHLIVKDYYKRVTSGINSIR